MDKVNLHKRICDKLNEIYKAKNADYGDSFSQLRQRYPNSICMRLFDKINRLDNLIRPDYKNKVSNESIEDTLMDIANYCIMELIERQNVNQNLKNTENPSNVQELLDKLNKISIHCGKIECSNCPAYVYSGIQYNCLLDFVKSQVQQQIDNLM